MWKMISHFSILLLVFFITFVVYVDSECAQGQVTTQITKYGSVDTHCIFRNMKLLPGSVIKLAFPDCLQCKCTTKSMSCCGFGYNAGKVAPPQGCIAHNDACKLIFVKENNPTEICKTTRRAIIHKKKPMTFRRL